MFEDMNKKFTMLFQWTFTTNNFKEFFNAYEMEERNDQFVDLTIGVCNMLATMWTIPTFVQEFDQVPFGKFWWIGFSCEMPTLWPWKLPIKSL